jgi:hypothetical protein
MTSTTPPPAAPEGDPTAVAGPAAGTPAALLALRGACEIHLPGDPGYDGARVPWNLAVEQRPAAVALPRTVDDVVALVTAAAADGLRVAPQNTGHGAAPLGDQPLDDVLLLRLSGLTGVEVDPGARTARVLGGTTWRTVLAATTPHALTAPHGSAPDVGAAGYLLNGGLSFYGRRHGLAVNALRSVEVVLPDGTVRRVDAHHDPELFWAVRGGGANLGVAVALEIDLIEQPDLVAGMMTWDRERAPEVVRAWRDWTRTVPESVTTSLRIMSFPPLPELPPFLSGRDLVVLDGALLEDDQTAAGLLTTMRELAPEMDTFARIPAADLPVVHMDPPGPTPSVADHAVLGDLDDDALAALLEKVGPGTRSDLLFAELRQLGGALARKVDGGGALSAIPGRYALLCLAVAPDPAAAVAGRAAASSVVRALAPWSLGSLAPTFTEARTDAGRFFGADVLARLRAVRDRVDPDRRMVAHHPL